MWKMKRVEILELRKPARRIKFHPILASYIAICLSGELNGFPPSPLDFRSFSPSMAPELNHVQNMKPQSRIMPGDSAFGIGDEAKSVTEKRSFGIE